MTAAARPAADDCDTGIDDALALLYACASAAADIVAVTCCGGNVAARDVAATRSRCWSWPAAVTSRWRWAARARTIARPLMITPGTHGPRGIGDAVLPVARRALSARAVGWS